MLGTMHFTIPAFLPSLLLSCKLTAAFQADVSHIRGRNGWYSSPRVKPSFSKPTPLSAVQIDLDDYTETSLSTPTSIFVAELENLSDNFPSAHVENVIRYDRSEVGKGDVPCLLRFEDEDDEECRDHTKHEINRRYGDLISDDEVVFMDIVWDKSKPPPQIRAFHRAGPRETLHFDPSQVNAAIVTCGGLCPGLNNVIRELVHSLYYLYGAKKVWGIWGGFHGFHNPEYPPVLLTCDLVENIHHEGGTVLRSSRGGFDIEKILSFLAERDINQLYIIGGDGTHRGAYAIHKAASERNMHLAVSGITKTIDNDIAIIDQSFGFQSAVEAAQMAIRTAKIEAMSNLPRGIGIVRLFGRSAGFLSAYAALGSGDVDLVIVPEVEIVLEGPNGILPFLRRRVEEHKFAVVVVAEGAGEELLGQSQEKDAGGNRKLPAIGEFLKNKIKDYFDSFGEEATIKYIDPSYTVRTVPANAADAMYCTNLGQGAVHGCMSGYTGFSVGMVNGKIVYIPIPELVKHSPRMMDPHGQNWNRLVALTGQPNPVPDSEM